MLFFFIIRSITLEPFDSHHPLIVLVAYFKFLCNRPGEFMMREQNGNYHIILVLFTDDDDVINGVVIFLVQSFF